MSGHTPEEREINIKRRRTFGSWQPPVPAAKKTQEMKRKNNCLRKKLFGKINNSTVRVENFEVFLISRFSWVADDTKIIHVEGGIPVKFSK